MRNAQGNEAQKSTIFTFDWKAKRKSQTGNGKFVNSSKVKNVQLQFALFDIFLGKQISFYVADKAENKSIRNSFRQYHRKILAKKNLQRTGDAKLEFFPPFSPVK